MSDESPEPIIECSRCGRNGLPPAECQLCEGKAPIQSRAYTLSEIRSGQVPDDYKDQHGPGRSVGPKIVQLPGSGTQGG